MRATTVYQRVALGSAPARRATHHVAGAVLAAGWRRTWTVDRPEANQPSRTMARVRRVWKDTLPPRSTAPGDGEPIAVMIPVGPRDLDVVGLAVDGARANLLDPLTSITLVAPDDLVDRLADAVPHVAVVAEDTVLCSEQTAMIQRGTPPARSAWYKQQLVKLQHCLNGPTRHTLVIDADTTLVRPQRFRTAQGDAMFVAAEYHLPYFDHLARLLGEDFSRPVFATTAHHMLYDRDALVELTTVIERRHPGRTWMEAVIDQVDAEQHSSFSEGELYGQWMVQQHRRQIAVHAFANVACRRGDLLPTTAAQLGARFGDEHDSISMHYYL